MSSDAPLLRAASLWEKTSAKGRRYLVGRLGELRLLIFENPRRGQEGEPDWTVHVGQAEQKATPGSQEPAGRAAGGGGVHAGRDERAPEPPQEPPLDDTDELLRDFDQRYGLRTR